MLTSGGFPEHLIERVLARAVERARADSPRALQLLRELDGKRLGLEVLGTPWRATLLCSHESLSLEPTSATPSADASVIGAPVSLLALAFDDPHAVVGRNGVRIDGDEALAQKFQQLATFMKPDLEELAGRLLGKSGAHLLLRALRAGMDWSRATATTTAQNLAEYLAHESRDLVPRAEAESHFGAVEQLRARLDLLEARVGQLQSDGADTAGRTERG